MRFTQECALLHIVAPVVSPLGVGGAVDTVESLRALRGEGSEERAVQPSSEEERGPDGGARRGDTGENALDFLVSPPATPILCVHTVRPPAGELPTPRAHAACAPGCSRRRSEQPEDLTSCRFAASDAQTPQLFPRTEGTKLYLEKSPTRSEPGAGGAPARVWQVGWPVDECDCEISVRTPARVPCDARGERITGPGVTLCTKPTICDRRGTHRAHRNEPRIPETIRQAAIKLQPTRATRIQPPPGGRAWRRMLTGEIGGGSVLVF